MSSALKSRPGGLLHVGRTRPVGALAELSDVVLVAEATDEDGGVLAAGLIGTVVTVLGGGEAYIVEFSEPRRALATLDAAMIRRAGDLVAQLVTAYPFG